ncbi:Helix-turn-helix domain-containing protein [Lentzea xinjiangensis]|uniref:Helix-turn-helix domain-containing protein n=2 Tax=Lentzea xinjiangensis TaxID=402600 RepID=A0A1H9VYK6_9PSEU|nr:Helix-turn-helix domain-containing protein [Lentzea xinjiangensis]
MTGVAAARATGMSQSKLSKIETGLLLPSVHDVERLVSELSGTREIRQELVELTRQLHDEVEIRRVILDRGAHRHQEAVALIESRAMTSRFFQHTRVPTLLQTEAYRLAVHGNTPARGQEAVINALQVRRSHMDDLGKRFVFVLTEAVLRWRIGPAELMCGQIDHLVELSRRPSVLLGVVPWSVNMVTVAPAVPRIRRTGRHVERPDR